jgi:hypothetical protein
VTPFRLSLVVCLHICECRNGDSLLQLLHTSYLLFEAVLTEIVGMLIEIVGAYLYCAHSGAIGQSNHKYGSPQGHLRNSKALKQCHDPMGLLKHQHDMLAIINCSVESTWVLSPANDFLGSKFLVLS